VSSTRSSAGLALWISKVVPAVPRVVFEAWLDPSALKVFLSPAKGTSAARVETEPRVGGRFAIATRQGDVELEHTGEYRVIEPFERLVFTWRSGAAEDPSQVSLTFEPVGREQTRLTLEHTGIGSEPAQRQHEQTWNRVFHELLRAITH